MAVNAQPEGYNTISPYLIVDGASELIDFMTKVFGAKERFRMQGVNGGVGHAEVQIGDSVIMLADSSEADNNRVITAMVHAYVDDCDVAYRAALDAGAKSEREPATQFYGDRNAAVSDRFGNIWYFSTHVEDVPPDEMERRSKEWAEQQRR